MLQAFVKLIAITVGALIVAVFAVVFVRWLGYQQVFKAPPHPWFEMADWKIFAPAEDELCSAAQTRKIEFLAGSIGSIPAYRDQTAQKWFICRGGKLPLAAFIEKTDHPDWLIRVQAHDTWGLDDLVKDLQALEPTRHFAIMSDSQKVGIFMRKKAPEMLFAADSASLLRFQMFESLWIETAMDFWPDFVVVDFSKNFHLDARGATELQRRQKRIIWHKSGLESAAPPPQVGIQGIMSSIPQ